MATRRKLDDALDYGRQLQAVHELQDGGASAAPEDIVAILDVSEVDADAQPKKITIQDLVSSSGAAAGSNTELQYNDNGNFGASADLTWDDTGKVLGVGGDIDLDDGGTYATTLQAITATANRTISFPDATGTVALVAGSSGQLVYNNAGAYAGVSTMTFDGTSVTLAGRLINSYTSLASSPAKVFTGTWFTGGTATTTKPHFLIEPAEATSTAWSTSGTGLGVNAASGYTGNLIDLQINGTRRVACPASGDNALTFKAGASTGNLYTDANSVAMWTGASFNQTAVYLVSNTSCGFIVNGSDRFTIKNGGSFRVVTGLTVATLPASPEVGDIARVTDATAPAVGSTVAGGGAAAALVWWNGSNWTVIGV